MKVTTYNTRHDLELAAKVSEDTEITGTVKQLKLFHLSHGQSVHGLNVVASDFIPTPPIENTPQRGKIYKSKLTNKNAKSNKSRPKKKSTRTHTKRS